MAPKLVALLLLCFLIAAQGNVNVYTDSVLTPFQDWGYGTHNAQDSTKVHSGNYSYSFVPTNYDAAYFYAGNGYINPTTYSEITFWIYRTSGSDDNINFNLISYNGTSNKVGQNDPITTYTGGSWAINTWVQATVLLSSFPKQNYDAFWLQYEASAPTTAYTVYIDDVVLVTAASSSAAAATTATSAKAATTTATTAAATTAKAATTSTTAATTAKASTTAAATTATTAKAATTTATTAAATTAKAATTSTTGAAATTAKVSTTTTGSSSSSTGGSPVVVAGDSSVSQYFTTATTGPGTYYGNYTSGGNCMLDPTPPDGLVSISVTVAAETSVYANSKTCGMCIQVTGTGTGSGANPITGTQLVYVNNECPSCSTDGLDFGEGGDGSWGLSWKAVPCPLEGNIQYVFKDGSGSTWIELQVRNNIVPVYTVELWSGGGYVELVRQSFNYFLGSSVSLTTPYKVRLTSVFGEQVVDTLSVIGSSQSVVYNGGVQFTLS